MMVWTWFLYWLCNNSQFTWHLASSTANKSLTPLIPRRSPERWLLYFQRIGFYSSCKSNSRVNCSSLKPRSTPIDWHHDICTSTPPWFWIVATDNNTKATKCLIVYLRLAAGPLPQRIQDTHKLNGYDVGNNQIIPEDTQSAHLANKSNDMATKRDKMTTSGRNQTSNKINHWKYHIDTTSHESTKVVSAPQVGV